MKPLTDVERRVVAAEDRLLFAENGLARGNVVVEDGARGDEGFVFVAKVRLAELGIDAKRSVVSGFGKFDAMRSVEKRRSLAIERHNAEIREAGFAFVRGEVSSESGDGGEHDARAIRNEFAPVVAFRIGDGRRDEAEGAAERVGTDEKSVAEAGEVWVMVEIVFVIVFAWGD